MEARAGSGVADGHDGRMAPRLPAPVYGFMQGLGRGGGLLTFATPPVHLVRRTRTCAPNPPIKQRLKGENETDKNGLVDGPVFFFLSHFRCPVYAAPHDSDRFFSVDRQTGLNLETKRRELTGNCCK